jgi:hypothetical protein
MYSNYRQCDWCSNYSDSPNKEYYKVGDKYYDVTFCSIKCKSEYRNERGIDYVPPSDWFYASEQADAENQRIKDRLINAGAEDMINAMNGNYPSRFKLDIRTQLLILLVGFGLIVYYIYKHM